MRQCLKPTNAKLTVLHSLTRSQRPARRKPGIRFCPAI
jgi:hypothetical protein